MHEIASETNNENITPFNWNNWFPITIAGIKTRPLVTDMITTGIPFPSAWKIPVKSPAPAAKKDEKTVLLR